MRISDWSSDVCSSDLVFVAGDLASVQQDGRPVPGVAPAAKQMGRHVADAIRARIAGKPAAPFRYRDYGNLATIGRMAAVVHLGKLKLSGALAWWFWLTAHIFFLIRSEEHTSELQSLMRISYAVFCLKK